MALKNWKKVRDKRGEYIIWGKNPKPFNRWDAKIVLNKIDNKWELKKDIGGYLEPITIYDDNIKKWKFSSKKRGIKTAKKHMRKY